MNKFGDWTMPEYQRLLGYRGERNTTGHAVHRMRSGIPASIDWRTKGAVTHVKNQGQCGSCWSFSATGSVEGAHFLHSNKRNLVSLSEQNLMDCSTSEGNQGCEGGLMDQAFQYIISNAGVDTESSYPYTAEDGTSCDYTTSNLGATISSYTDIPSGSETSLANAVGSVGPVSVAIDANHNSFMYYTSGVLTIDDCSTSQLDHGVLAVGYGSSQGQQYWIVKNSWGTDWGINGYVWMRKDHGNMCGIATAASYPVV